MQLDKIISGIIKNGDKTTLKNIITLLSIVKGDKNTISSVSSFLEFCKDYESSKSSQKPIKENVQPVAKTQPTVPQKVKDPTVDFAANLFEHSLGSTESTGKLTVHSKSPSSFNSGMSVKDSSSQFSSEELDMLSTYGNLI
jgi:hypothetical protein